MPGKSRPGDTDLRSAGGAGVFEEKLARRLVAQYFFLILNILNED